MKLNVTSFQPIVCSQFLLTPTSGDPAVRIWKLDCSCMGSVLFSIMLKETHAADYVGQSFPEVGWYGKTCLFSLWTLVVKSAVRIWIGLDGFFSLTHFATNTSSTTQPHKIPANNLRNAIFTMFVLAWVLSCFPTCWKIHIQQIMLAKVFNKVGWYGKTCLFSLWTLVVKSAVRIWIGLDVFFHRSLRNQQAVPHNRTKYQQTTCATQFSPCLFLHDFCPVFQHAERDTYSRLCWPKFSRGRLVR